MDRHRKLASGRKRNAKQSAEGRKRACGDRYQRPASAAHSESHEGAAACGLPNFSGASINPAIRIRGRTASPDQEHSSTLVGPSKRFNSTRPESTGLRFNGAEDGPETGRHEAGRSESERG